MCCENSTESTESAAGLECEAVLGRYGNALQILLELVGHSLYNYSVPYNASSEDAAFFRESTPNECCHESCERDMSIFMVGPDRVPEPAMQNSGSTYDRIS